MFCLSEKVDFDRLWCARHLLHLLFLKKQILKVSYCWFQCEFNEFEKPQKKDYKDFSGYKPVQKDLIKDLIE